MPAQGQAMPASKRVSCAAPGTWPPPWLRLQQLRLWHWTLPPKPRTVPGTAKVWRPATLQVQGLRKRQHPSTQRPSRDGERRRRRLLPLRASGPSTSPRRGPSTSHPPPECRAASARPLARVAHSGANPRQRRRSARPPCTPHTPRPLPTATWQPLLRPKKPSHSVPPATRPQQSGREEEVLASTAARARAQGIARHCTGAQAAERGALAAKARSIRPQRAKPLPSTTAAAGASALKPGGGRLGSSSTKTPNHERLWPRQLSMKAAGAPRPYTWTRARGGRSPRWHYTAATPLG
mmetsp:Transcript_7553/g.15708  ORF Transcript_7553/g.15708 Transcript_7553/m.15708 type:complete len:294 (-) Transcript_7553:279-1160(-)